MTYLKNMFLVFVAMVATVPVTTSVFAETATEYFYRVDSYRGCCTDKCRQSDDEACEQEPQQCPPPSVEEFIPDQEAPMVSRSYGGGYVGADSSYGQATFLEPMPPPIVAVIPLGQDGMNVTVDNQRDRDRQGKRWDRSDHQFQHRSDFRREDRRDHATRGDDSSTRRRDFSSQQVHPGNTSMHNDRVRRGNLSPQQRSMSAPTQPTHRSHFGGGGTMPPAYRSQAQMQAQPTPQPRMTPRPQPMSASRIQQPQVRQIQPQQNTPQNNGAIRGGRR